MKKKKRIGIVGAAISEGDLLDRSGQYNPNSTSIQIPKEPWELWGVNNIHTKFPDVTFSKWFEIHDIKMQRGTFLRRGYSHYPPASENSVHDYLKGLDDLGIPVYMQRKWARVKKSIAYPHDKIVEEFGSYMGCSIAWMTALAIQQKADMIGFFGIHLTGNEYYYQRPSTEYMIGIAEGRGIGITIDESSRLLHGNYEYAFGEDFNQIYLLHGQFAEDVTHTIINAISERIDHHSGTEVI